MKEPSSFEIKVSRKAGYAAVLKTAPAYTFGGKHERFPNDPGPGPGTYEPSLEFHKKGGGFGSSTRYQQNSGASPSPQDYNITGTDLKSSAAYTMRGSHAPTHLQSKTPGPGHYESGTGKDQVQPTHPAISIASRRQERPGGDRKPGPNEYNPDYRVKEPAGVSIKFRHDRLHEPDTPGPNQYQRPMERAHTSPTAKTFGSSRPQMLLDNGVPGPIYSLDPYDKVKPRRTSWSIGKSPRDSRLDNGVPGPGTYGVHAPVVDRPAGHGVKSHERSQPAYTIPGKAYFSPLGQSPGPSDYNPKDVRKSAPVFTLHGSDIKDSRRNYPGPGAYSSDDTIKSSHPSAPALSISHRPADAPARDRKPGPGAYDNTDFKVKETPGVTIKFRHDRSLDNGVPAPHDYADKDFRSIYGTGSKRKGISFGIKHRGYVQESVPGPEYNVSK